MRDWWKSYIWKIRCWETKFRRCLRLWKRVYMWLLGFLRTSASKPFMKRNVWTKRISRIGWSDLILPRHIHFATGGVPYDCSNNPPWKWIQSFKTLPEQFARYLQRQVQQCSTTLNQLYTKECVLFLASISSQMYYLFGRSLSVFRELHTEKSKSFREKWEEVKILGDDLWLINLVTVTFWRHL